MISVFKKIINGKEYSFHRTTANDLLIYFVIYTNANGERTSFKVEKNNNGTWQLAPDAPESFKSAAFPFIGMILQNENSTP
jgi:hypothetical protein